MGVFEGRKDPLVWMRFSLLWNHWFLQRHPQKRIGGGESFEEAAFRFLAFTSQLTEKHGASPAAILRIAHGGILKVGLPGWLKNLNFELVRNTPIPFTSLINTTGARNKWVYLEGLETLTPAAG